MRDRLPFLFGDSMGHLGWISEKIGSALKISRSWSYIAQAYWTIIFAGYADDTTDMKTGISTILFSCDKLIFDNIFLHLQCQNQTIYYQKTEKQTIYFHKTEKQTIYFQKTEKQTIFLKKTGMGVVHIKWSAPYTRTV